jgi:hypothetical protein
MIWQVAVEDPADRSRVLSFKMEAESASEAVRRLAWTRWTVLEVQGLSLRQCSTSEVLEARHTTQLLGQPDHGAARRAQLAAAAIRHSRAATPISLATTEHEASVAQDRSLGALVVEWLRWVAVLPAAVVGSVVIGALLTLVFGCSAGRFIDHGEIEIVSGWSRLLGAFVSGSAFVYCGSFTAPRHQRVVGLVLAGLMIFIVGASFVLTLGTGEWGRFVLSLISLGGSVVAAVVLHRPDEPDRPYERTEPRRRPSPS